MIVNEPPAETVPLVGLTVTSLRPEVMLVTVKVAFPLLPITKVPVAICPGAALSAAGETVLIARMRVVPGGGVGVGGGGVGVGVPEGRGVGVVLGVGVPPGVGTGVAVGEGVGVPAGVGVP